jgi:O-Antigen ligase
VVGARSLPAVAVVAGACLLAWAETGSIDAADWLLYAVLAALLLAVVAFAGSPPRPPAAALAGLVLLIAYAGWQAVSIAWSALPSLARDDALLTLFYAVVLAIGLSVRGAVDRGIVVAAVAAGSGALAVATGAALRFGSAPEADFGDGRLAFPVTYTNGAAAMFLVGFWPALVLAARRGVPLPARAGALAAAAATLAGWLLTQSKGGGIALCLSAIAVLAASRDRLRLLIPGAIAGVLVGSQFDRLTAAYTSADIRGAARDAGVTLLWLTAAAAVVGMIYALLDQRLELSARWSRIVARAAVVALVLAVIAAPLAFFATVDHPGRWAADEWRTFKHSPSHETSATHFGSLGSNRYDFWRVALNEFEDHPLAGIGDRGFGPAYLVERRSGETPVRAHSFELDALSELGVVGFLLLLGALAPLVLLAARGAWRGDLAATAGFATAAYFLIHASADWIWTIPAVGLPVFVLLGAACARDDAEPMPRYLAAGVGVAAIAAAVLAFAPPWLSARFSNHALESSSSPASDLRWARRLDPLSVEPYLVQSKIAPTPAAALEPLQKAVAKEPRSVDVHFELALGYVRAHRLRAARRELQRALRLEPGAPAIEQALSRLTRR